jgi:hypothetical protein
VIRLSGICAALQAADEDRGVRSMADLAGMAKSTYHAAAADPHKLSLAAVLALAGSVPEIKAALMDALSGTVEVGRPGDASRDGFGAMVSGNRALGAIAMSLADGTYSPAEARTDLPILREHQHQVARLILDVQAVAAVGGQIGARS